MVKISEKLTCKDCDDCCGTTDVRKIESKYSGRVMYLCKTCRKNVADSLIESTKDMVSVNDVVTSATTGCEAGKIVKLGDYSAVVINKNRERVGDVFSFDNACRIPLSVVTKAVGYRVQKKC